MPTPLRSIAGSVPSAGKLLAERCTGADTTTLAQGIVGLAPQDGVILTRYREYDSFRTDARSIDVARCDRQLALTV